MQVRDEPYVKFSVRLPARLKRQLENRAFRTGNTFTEELKLAVERGLSEATLAAEGLTLVVAPSTEPLFEPEGTDEFVDVEAVDDPFAGIPKQTDEPTLEPGISQNGPAGRGLPCKHRVPADRFCFVCDN